MAWIESHQGLARHLKTKRLARKLEISVPAVIGHLHLLWWWAMDNLPNGRVSDLEPEDIADEMMWTGNAKNLIDSLIDVGFIDRLDDGLYIHDWQDYIGRLLDKRKADADRKRTSRESSNGRPMEKTRTGVGNPKDGAGNRTVPNSTIKDIPQFDEFWSIYPRKIEKTDALSAWNNAIKRGGVAEDIYKAVEVYKSEIKKDKTETSFIKHPASFLNKDRWKEKLIVVDHVKKKHINVYDIPLNMSPELIEQMRIEQEQREKEFYDVSKFRRDDYPDSWKSS